MAHSGRRSADEVLAVELASGRTLREACEVARVSERTAYRRLHDPKFMARVQDLRADMVSRASGRLASAMTAAANKLQSLSESAKSEFVQLSASRAVIEMAHKIRELNEIEQRLKQLEAQDRDGDEQCPLPID